MASDATTNTVLLEALDRLLKNKPHERAEITINGGNYEVVNSALDFLMRDPASSLLAARIILTVRDIPRDPDYPTTELAAHITTTTSPDVSSSSSSSTVILDDAQLRARDRRPGAPGTAAPRRASTIPTHPPSSTASTRSTRSSSRRPLAETYREYIPAFMEPDPETAEARLQRFLHQPVTHNDHALSADEYHSLGRVVRWSVPDIGCEIVDLIADEERQVVAARLEFAGTRVEEEEGVGRAVRLGEIVFYWFDEGKIREVVSVVDLKGLNEGRS